MKVFESRKNKVFRSSKEWVVKQFRDTESFEIEHKTMEILDGVASPKLIFYSDKEIVMEYLDGDLLIDIYLSCSEDESLKFGKLLAETISLLSEKLPGKITFDENFRNYIFYNKKIYRVDFEETRDGNIIEWLSKIMAFACLYEVPLINKLGFCKALIGSFSLDKQKLVSTFEKELVFLSLRWKQEFPQEIFDEVSNIIN